MLPDSSAVRPGEDGDVLAAVEASRTRQLFDQGFGALAVTLAASVGLWLTASLPGIGISVWLAVVLIVLLLRLLLVLAFRRLDPDRPLSAWWNGLYSAGTLASGVLFALWPVLFFPSQGLAPRLLGALILGAMAGGAVAVLSVRRDLALGYGFLLLVPASAMLAVTAGRDGVVVGVLGLLFFLAMVNSVRLSYQRISHALIYSFRNARLLQDASRHEQALEAQNQALSQAREALEQSNRGLAQRVAERTRDLEQLAVRDVLTGMLNRRGISERIEQQLDEQGMQLAVLFIDLDGFKEINDAMGHDTGDAVLVEVASRLRGAAQGASAIGRWGGDEFLVLHAESDRGDAGHFEARAHALVEALAQPIPFRGTALRINSCVGIAVAPQDGTSLDRLVRNADMAVYAAKDRGPGSCVRFDSRLADAVERVAQIRQHLREALAADGAGLRLVYQPILCAAQRTLLGAECLLRWHHPQLGDVGPGEFIAVAERSGLMPALGGWVLDQACAFLVSVPAARLPYLAVNISTVQVLQTDCAARVAERTRVCGVDPSRLLLELTESAFAQDSEQVITTMQHLRELGVRLALDDFGTGYSSLAHLQRLPLQVLKIDQRFVADLQGGGARIVEASQSLAQAFRLQTVAEGVETAEQAQHLQALGVFALQGYYFSRPLERDAFVDGLAQPTTWQRR